MHCIVTRCRAVFLAKEVQKRKTHFQYITSSSDLILKVGLLTSQALNLFKMTGCVHNRLTVATVGSHGVFTAVQSVSKQTVSQSIVIKTFTITCLPSTRLHAPIISSP